MTAAFPLAQHTYPVLTIFSVFVASALLLSVWVTSDRATTRDFYVSDGRLTSVRNGLALFGAYMSAATLLGTPGLIALVGYDGIPYLLGPTVACLVILLLVAEPYHTMGRFTVGDTLAHRLRPRPVHRAAGVATLAISLMYLVAQLVGAGALAAPILGIDGPGARQATVACLGVLMILYLLIGGMRATTVIQAAKALVMLGGGAVLSVAVLARFHGDPMALLSAAAHHSGLGDRFLRPGVVYGNTAASELDAFSLQLAALLGAAGLPHLLMRINAVPDARAARRSVQWATVLTTVFCLMAGVLAFGATALLGPKAITADNPSGNTAVLLTAERLGGTLLLTVVTCVAFITILAVVSGVTLAAATSLSHDLYGAVLRRGRASDGSELVVARLAILLIGTAATAGSMFADGLNIAFMAALAFVVAASAVLPALLYGFYWRRFTTRGATWSIYGGLGCALLLVALSPEISGNPAALLPHLDFAVIPLRNPAVISVPTGFLLGWLGSVLDRREPGGAGYAETDVRILAAVPAGPDQAFRDAGGATR